MRGRAPLIGLVAVLLIGLAFWFLLYSPRSDEIETVRAETATLETQRQSLQNEIAQLREIEANQIEIRAALARLEEYIPSGTAQSTAVRQFQLAGDASGVEIISLQFDAPTPLDGAPPTGVADTVLARIPVAMTVQGGYFQIVDFFRRIEVEVTRAVFLGEVRVGEAEDEGFPNLNATWSGNLFGVVPVPPPPPPVEVPGGSEGQPVEGEAQQEGTQ
jgi:Tfp pilus assembly protein PilO